LVTGYGQKDGETLIGTKMPENKFKEYIAITVLVICLLYFMINV